MHIEAFHLVFNLSGCRSLKERRGRLGGLRDRIGRQAALALHELPGDDPTSSEWCVLAIGANRSRVDRLYESVRETALRSVDAELIDATRETL